MPVAGASLTYQTALEKNWPSCYKRNSSLHSNRSVRSRARGLCNLHINHKRGATTCDTLNCRGPCETLKQGHLGFLSQG